MQSDLFATRSDGDEAPNEEVVAILRQRLHETLSLVKSASTMPWGDAGAIIREDNRFRYAKDALPREEGDRLWREFEAEMDRLYATLPSEG